MHMSIFVRIWAAFTLVLLIGGLLTLHALQQQIKPNMRQVVEDTLADNANLIAGLVADDLLDGRLSDPAFDQKIQAALSRDLNAKIRSMSKTTVQQTLYITDVQGIVRYDSTGVATGQDYSRWNDVYLTLRGQYGARSTRSNPDDENSSVMYVAAPVIDQGKIIGVVSVGKAGVTVQPYIENAQRDMLQQAGLMLLVSLLLFGVAAGWLRHSINKVRRYALSLPVQALPAPHFYSASELNDLTRALAQMRSQLENRAYIEQVVHHLTHELKSPLAAINASAELLQDPLPPPDQQRFALNIQQQTERLHHLVERLLILVRLEQQVSELTLQPCNLSQLVTDCLQARQSLLLTRQIHVKNSLPAELWVQAEPFWLGQAIGNLLDNAIDFTPAQGEIRLTQGQDEQPHKQRVHLIIENDGEPIPAYALSHVFDRYYSLPRPTTGRKSSGIGLTLVKEIMFRHNSLVRLENSATGVSARLWLIAADPRKPTSIA